MTFIGRGLFAVALLLPAAAFAQETRVIIEDEPDALLQVGAGVHDFTEGLDGATESGTGWDVRAVFAPKNILSMEVAYFGGLNELRRRMAPEGVPESDANLLTTGGEALLRANFGGDRGDVQPYVAAGLGVAEHRVVDRDDVFDEVANNSFQNSTDILVPTAAGVDIYLAENIALGARLGYKFYFEDEVIADEDAANVQSWAATARLGAAF